MFCILGEFTRYPKRKLLLTASGIIPVPNVKQCAATCISMTEFSCTSFDYCGNNCIMFTNMIISGKDIKSTDKCDRYASKYESRYVFISVVKIYLLLLTKPS